MTALIESPNALYITFDNVGVGRMMAKAILAAKPAGNYAFIKGDKGDPNADFLFSGITEVLEPAMNAGKIKNVGEVLHRRLEAGQRAEEHGADPHQEQQQGRRGRLRERRHGRRRRRGAHGAGHGRLGAGVRPGRRPRGDQPHRARHADRVDLEGRRDLGKIAGEAAVALADGKKMTDIADVKPFTGGAKGVKVNGILLTPLPSPRTTST